MASHTALVIGAQGVLGSAIVRALRDEGWDVVRSGRHREDAADFRLIDLDQPSSVVSQFTGADIVVNAAEHPGLAAERAVLELGGIALNVSAISRVATSAMASESDGTPGGCAIVHCGLAPGVVSLAARDLVERHPEADEIELGLVFSARATAGRSGVQYVHREFTAASRHPTVRLPLLAPFGARRAVRFAEADRGWLGHTADNLAVKSYACFEERTLNWLLVTLNALRLNRLLPLKPFLSSISLPGDELTREPVQEWVALRSRGKRIAACVVTAAGDYAATAQAAVAFADAALRRWAAGTLDPGVWTCEEVFSLAELERDFCSRGIAVKAVQ